VKSRLHERVDSLLQRDPATRGRLFEAATRLFSERGFAHVTVRQICLEAGANLAAVNYHFGDKAGLYAHVVEAALEAVRGLSDEAMNAGPSASAEDKLRHYIRAYLVRTGESTAARRAWVIRNLFRHEMTSPTSAARPMLEQAVLPRIRYLSGIVASLLGTHATDEIIRHCVVSIQAQCLIQIASPQALGCPPARSHDELEALAEHIVAFSLAGIRGLAARARRR